MKQRRIVIDTNIFVSAVFFEKSTPSRAFQTILKKNTFLLSQALFLEFKEVLQRQKFEHYLPLEERNNILLNFSRETVLWVKPTKKITICRDPKDNMILELAIAGMADCIITGDEDLLVLNPFQGIDIITPAEFLRRR